MPFGVCEAKLAVPYISLFIIFYITIYYHDLPIQTIINNATAAIWHVLKTKVLGTTEGAAAQRAAWHQAITEIMGQLVHNQISCTMMLTNIHARIWFRSWQVVPIGSLSWPSQYQKNCWLDWSKILKNDISGWPDHPWFKIDQVNLGSKVIMLCQPWYLLCQPWC